jgi:hypothetical protein
MVVTVRTGCSARISLIVSCEMRVSPETVRRVMNIGVSRVGWI